MFESILSYTSGSTITITNALISMLISFVVGIIISLTYMKTQTKKHSENFALTIVILPTVIAVIIILIGSDIARAFSLAGAFSIIRFRSAPGEPRDIAFVLFAMAAGLATGVGVGWFAIVFSALVCFMMVVLNSLKFGQLKSNHKRLKITIPEDLDFQDAFYDVFKKYTNSYDLIHVKTTAMGSLYQLTYDVEIIDNTKTKSFIDDLRCINNNLNISMNLLAEAEIY